MKFEKLEIDGAWLVTTPINEDDRGKFFEWFKFSEIEDATEIHFQVKQANVSVSKKGALRGIHYSLAQGGQAKWVTCSNGHILDVVVDIRPESPTFKKYIQINLKSGDGKALLIGRGLGHGFLALEDNSIVSYLLDSQYSPSEEFAINSIDPDLEINWHLELIGGSSLIRSQKDIQAPTIAQQLEAKNLPHFN
jgi:dTDP-4-dehydrorhamnose 3,5-epimerase